MKDLLTTGAARSLERALDVAAYRQSLIAGNIANLDTPGYKAKDIRFAEELREATEAPGAEGPAAPARPGATLHEAETGRLRGDGNTVDIDREMLNLSRTAGYYAAGVEMLKKYIGILKAAITEGRA